MRRSAWLPWVVVVVASALLSGATTYATLSAVADSIEPALRQAASGAAPASAEPTAVAPVESAAAEKAPGKGPGMKKPVGGFYPPVVDRKGKYAAPTDEQKRWALATAAILTEANNERHDTLAGCDDTPDNEAIAKQVLSGSWGIQGRGDLLDTLDWIEKEGHRKGFDNVVSITMQASPEELDKMVEEAGGRPEVEQMLEIAAEHGEQLGAGGIASWDYGRYVFLCRRGYLLGYLSEEEAWSRIMPAARAVQASYGSWEEFGDSYLVGRSYWSGRNEDDPVMKRACNTMLTQPGSPWRTLPWDLDLGSPKK